MGNNERGVLLAVLHFKSALSFKTFLCTTFMGNYCYSRLHELFKFSLSFPHLTCRQVTVVFADSL